MPESKYPLRCKSKPTEFEWVTISELNQRIATIDRKLDEGIACLERLRLAGKHDTPDYNRVFEPWERLLIEFNRYYDVLELAELTENLRSDNYAERGNRKT